MATASATSKASSNGCPILLALGIDAIWLSPIFPSPMADFGYDISDYTGIDPLFGTMADFDALVSAAHEAGLKVILDLVPNHTSDQHPWFVESRVVARQSEARLVHLARSGSRTAAPPNNWLSEFGGSAWAVRCGNRAILLSRLPRPAAGPELAQSRRCARRSTT